MTKAQATATTLSAASMIGLTALIAWLAMTGLFSPKLAPHEKAQIRTEAYAELREHTHFQLDSAFVFGYVSAFADEHEKGNAVLLGFDYWASPRLVATVDTTGDTTIVTPVGRGLFEAVRWGIWRPDGFIEVSLGYEDPSIDSLLAEPYRPPLIAEIPRAPQLVFYALPYLAKIERRYETGVLLQRELAATRRADVRVVTALELRAYQSDRFFEFDYVWADTVEIANSDPYVEGFAEMKIVGWHVWDGGEITERREFPINWHYVLTQEGVNATD